MREIIVNELSDLKIKDNILTLNQINIDLNECNKNRKKIINKNIKSVGERDITSKPPYYELFTDNEHTKILFKSKSVFFRKNKSEILFHNFMKLLRENRYTTLDLS